MKSGEDVLVRIGELKVANDGKNIITRGLGSCVAMILYDNKRKVGGMIHFLLPENPGDGKKTKYADTGIKLLIGKMVGRGAKKENLEAKLVGGAVMFGEIMEDKENAIGRKNLKKAKQILEENKIPVSAEDVGGDYGRSAKLDVSSGRVSISSYKTGDKEI